MHKRFALRLGTFALPSALLASARPSLAAKPEDVFKGKIIITKNRLPMRFSSPGASSARSEEQDRQDLADRGERRRQGELEPGVPGLLRAAAGRQRDPGEVLRHHPGARSYVAGDPQYTRERGSRIFGSSITAGQARVRRAQALHDDHRVAGPDASRRPRSGCSARAPTTAARSSSRTRTRAASDARPVRESAAGSIGVVVAVLGRVGAARLGRGCPWWRRPARRRREEGEAGRAPLPQAAGPSAAEIDTLRQALIGADDAAAAEAAAKLGDAGSAARGRALLEVLAEGGRAARVQAALDALGKLGAAHALRADQAISTRWSSTRDTARPTSAGAPSRRSARSTIRGRRRPAGAAGRRGARRSRRGRRRAGGPPRTNAAPRLFALCRAGDAGVAAALAALATPDMVPRIAELAGTIDDELVANALGEYVKRADVPDKLRIDVLRTIGAAVRAPSPPRRWSSTSPRSRPRTTGPRRRKRRSCWISAERIPMKPRRRLAACARSAPRWRLGLVGCAHQSVTSARATPTTWPRRWPARSRPPAGRRAVWSSWSWVARAVPGWLNTIWRPRACFGPSRPR